MAKDIQKSNNKRLAIIFKAIVTFACIMIHMRYGYERLEYSETTSVS